jgi:AcrR family transcriptional regulator
VAEEAAVSRGAMLHQFPTRTDLMLFVVRSVYEEELHAYAARFAAIPDPREQLLSLPEIVWEVLSRPSGVAVLEILQGARSDPELAERLRPLQARIEANSFTQVGRLAQAAGRTAPPALIRLVVWAVRGLSIAQTLSDDPAAGRDSIRLLRGQMALLLDASPREAS